MNEAYKSSMVRAVADGILWGARYGNVHGEQVIYMLQDGTFEARHDTDRGAPDDALEIVRIGNLDELLGPEWSEGLALDEDGRAIVSDEQAQEWATWWVAEFGAQSVEEAEDREDGVGAGDRQGHRRREGNGVVHRSILHHRLVA